MVRNIWPRLFFLGSIVAILILPLKSWAAVSPFLPFGGKILNIAAIAVNPLCPANVGFIATIGLPLPAVVNLPITAPPLVRNGPAVVGAWTIGLATPPVLPCLPIVFLMGVSRTAVPGL